MQPEAEAALALDTANKEETANVAKDGKKSDGYGPGKSEEKPAPAFASFAGTAAPFAATAGSGQAFSFGSAAAGAPKADFGETGKLWLTLSTLDPTCLTCALAFAAELTGPACEQEAIPWRQKASSAWFRV